jgi:hypothetical protein
MLAYCLLVCVLVLLAVAIGLGVGFSKRNDDPPATFAPTTQAPTPIPPPTPPPVRMPVSLPPREPLPTFEPKLDEPTTEIVLLSTGDTTIYRDGILAEEPQGSELTMLVQSGEAGNIDLPSAFALIQFDLNGTTVDRTDGNIVAIMCLVHLPNTTEVERVATYSTCLVLPIDDSYIESWSAADASFEIPESCDGGVVEFNVSSSDESFCIDVSSALMRSTSRLRGRQRSRQLQDTSSILLMIDAAQLGVEQAGDRFYTREEAKEDLRPTLTLSQDNETDSPSVVNTETTAPNNSTIGDFDPCGICVEGELATLPEVVLPVPPELLPDGVPAEEANCGMVDELCSNGFCNEDVCAQLANFAPTISPLCGCELVV